MTCASLLRSPMNLLLRMSKGHHFNQRITSQRYLSKNSVVNAERRYSEKHEWISLNGEIGTIGISHYAQESLGEIVYCQLPQVGDKYDKGDEVGAVESVKAASEVYTPVSGEIVERNDKAEENPSIINKSCYEKGWLFKLKLTDHNELQKLMSESAYQEFLKRQSHD
ncbi:hypothetical protein HELRODRAFT_185416 [Helobdella robusta]|uniref:Glycine cleavage system H protein n=1 Tax=Helobdella robusta TaxID=6412 RepID=T1FMS6_HELRO|nr:hypothetical protein HELRODRAFT_185416 [Helobdella robusta]ESO08029.1 hypothetical protein HELRODRAFT_185416 [Helobdella robusta]